MFDIGWQELFVIVAVGIVVIGPKDLPRVLSQMTKYIRKARSIAQEFQNSVEEVMREAEVEDIRKEVEKASKLDLGEEIRNTIDPTGEIARDLDFSGPRSELEQAAASVTGIGKDAEAEAGKTAESDDAAAPEPPAVTPESPTAQPESPSVGTDDAPKEPPPDDPAKSASG